MSSLTVIANIYEQIQSINVFYKKYREHLTGVTVHKCVRQMQIYPNHN